MIKITPCLHGNKLRKTLLLLIIYLFSSSFHLAISQSKKADIPVVEFKNRKFVTDIPYGQPFIIKVPNTFDGKKSNICEVIIKEKGKDDVVVSSAYDWLDAEDEEAKQFELIFRNFEHQDASKKLKLNNGLKLDGNYTFEIKFFLEESYSPDESILKRIVYESTKHFETFDQITPQDMENILTKIEAELKTNKKFTTLDFDNNNQISIDKSKLKLFRFPLTTSKGIVTLDDFGELAREKNQIKSETSNLNTHKTKLLQNKNNFIAALDKIESCDSKLSETIQRVKEFIENQRYQSTSNLDFRTLSKDKCSKPHKTIINAIDASFSNFSKTSNNILESTTLITEIESRIGSLNEIVREGIRLVGLFTTDEAITVNSKAQLKKLRVGTAFGGSVAFLNTINADNEINLGNTSPFGYFALKFYLCPVDRGLRYPYLSDKKIINRTSIYAGLKAIGDLNYRGTNLANFIGTKPVAGLSYDFHPNFSLDIGTVLFSQDSVYPLVEGQRHKFRAALTIGISFDPDLINQFRALITNEKYKIP